MSFKDFERVAQLDDVLVEAIYSNNRTGFRNLTSKARQKYRQHQLSLSVEAAPVTEAEEGGGVVENALFSDFVLAETEQRLGELMDTLF